MKDTPELQEEHPFDASAREGGVTIVSLMTSLLRRRRLLLFVLVLGITLALTLVLSRGRYYTVATTFIPQSKGGAGGGLAGFAAQLGVAVAGEGADQSPSFYVDLVQARAILGNVVDSPRVVVANGSSRMVSLADVFEVKPGDSVYRRDLAIDELRKAISASFSQRTGVVRVAVTLPSASLAKDVVEQIVRELARFNLNKRQGQAAAERRFTEQRMAQAAADLRAAEGRQQEFLLRNREFRSAPQLQFEYERLNREVMLRQQLYGSLAQAYDRAKIDEVRDTPLVTQIERPEIPSRPDPRGLGRWLVVAAIVSLVTGSALALFLDYMAMHEGDADSRQAFIDARRAASADLRRPWRLLRREPRRT